MVRHLPLGLQEQPLPGNLMVDSTGEISFAWTVVHQEAGMMTTANNSQCETAQVEGEELRQFERGAAIRPMVEIESFYPM